MRNIVLTKNNIIDSSNNSVFRYNFPSTVKFTKNQKVALAKTSIYYSWNNIASTLNNNTFSYQWDNGAGLVSYNVVIPDGLYNISDLNNYLHYVMISNSHYLINSSGDFVYYAELEVNPNRYAIQINTYNVPTVLPAGFSTPSGWGGFPLQSFNPVITFPASSTINNIFGYIAGFATNANTNNAYVPPVSPYISKVGSTLSYISTQAPNVQPFNTLLFTSNIINNQYGNPNNVLFSLAITDASAGSLINENYPELLWCDINEGSYSYIEIRILDAGTLTNLIINDPNIVMILVFKDE